jgi:tetratricopeptide (TPR) repeat protein
VYRDAGRLDEAAQSLRDALTVLPRLAEARWMLADVLDRAGHGLDAVRELEAAASATIIAGKGALYSRAAEIYDRHQEFDRVVTMLRHRVSLDPNNPAVHRQLGLVYSRLGRRDEALAELVIADLLGGADADAEGLAAIGQIHLDAGRLEDAETVARRAVAVRPDRQDARYVLGRALLRQGRTAEAREELDAFQRLRAGALAEQRRTFEVDKLRADAAQASAAGRHGDAASIWRRVIEQMPRVPDFHISAADAFAASGELEDATVHLEKAASLGGGPAVRLRLAELYERLGRREDSARARRVYEQQVKELLNSSRP